MGSAQRRTAFVGRGGARPAGGISPLGEMEHCSLCSDDVAIRNLISPLFLHFSLFPIDSVGEKGYNYR